MIVLLTDSLGGEFDARVTVCAEHLHLDKGAGGAATRAGQVSRRHHSHSH